jgi:hypothetical protein
MASFGQEGWDPTGSVENRFGRRKREPTPSPAPSIPLPAGCRVDCPGESALGCRRHNDRSDPIHKPSREQLTPEERAMAERVDAIIGPEICALLERVDARRDLEAQRGLKALALAAKRVRVLGADER